MEDESLQQLPSLTSLQMTNNKLTSLNTIPLCELKNLRELNLSNNSIYSLKNAQFYCRELSNNVGLNLNNENLVLGLDSKEYFSISDKTFKLEKLDLSYNNISELSYALADLQNLKMLNLEGNKLESILNKHLSSVKSLETVNLKNNLLENIDERIFSNQTDLLYLDLSYNRITNFSINNAPLLEYISLGHNMLNTFSLTYLNDLNKLKTLMLHNNKIQDVYPSTFQGLIALEELDLSNNKIKLQNDSFTNLYKLEQLSLSNNSISVLPLYVFRNLTNLKTLDLSKNMLRTLSTNVTFRNLVNLEILNISYNRLEELNFATIDPLNNLNVLDIAGNRLHYIQYDVIISRLPLLSVLNLKANLLSCELLYKIITFLKHRNMSYTISEEFDYTKENVAGIYCDSEKKIVSESLINEHMSGGGYALLILGGILGVVLVLIVIVVSLFKIHLFLKEEIVQSGRIRTDR
ncbi:hypothetical protein NQ317_006413 [Molorchus minor]|uniref:Uncharacterized protein n=1 Tax=Molorchus minor TaxID=1323400 RepID=A0ABQ9JX00_9CUCU|nr:hypothetical protein NQ317_006413 [Molorchus minor]